MSAIRERGWVEVVFEGLAVGLEVGLGMGFGTGLATGLETKTEGVAGSDACLGREIGIEWRTGCPGKEGLEAVERTTGFDTVEDLVTIEDLELRSGLGEMVFGVMVGLIKMD